MAKKVVYVEGQDVLKRKTTAVSLQRQTDTNEASRNAVRPMKNKFNP